MQGSRAAAADGAGAGNSCVFNAMLNVSTVFGEARVEQLLKEAAAEVQSTEAPPAAGEGSCARGGFLSAPRPG